MKEQFIQKFLGKKYLFWDIDKAEEISEDALLERIINYGSWEDFLVFINEFGIKKASQIFAKNIKKSRPNYSKKAINYFTLFFQNNAR